MVSFCVVAIQPNPTNVTASRTVTYLKYRSTIGEARDNDVY